MDGQMYTLSCILNFTLRFGTAHKGVGQVMRVHMRVHVHVDGQLPHTVGSISNNLLTSKFMHAEILEVLV